METFIKICPRYFEFCIGVAGLIFVEDPFINILFFLLSSALGNKF